MSEPLELELEVLMGHLTWVLGTDYRFYTRTVSDFTTISLVPPAPFCLVSLTLFPSCCLKTGSDFVMQFVSGECLTESHFCGGGGGAPIIAQAGLEF